MWGEDDMGRCSGDDIDPDWLQETPLLLLALVVRGGVIEWAALVGKAGKRRHKRLVMVAKKRTYVSM